MNLQGKIVVVTGASTGIGRATVIEFAKAGAKVCLLGRNKEKLQEVEEEIGENAEIFEVDLSMLSDVQNIAKKIKEKFEKIDIIANIAGIWHGEKEVYANKNYEDFQTSVIVDTMNVGLVAPMLLVYNLVDSMSKGGSIINLSGTFNSGGKGWLPYYVSKRGIEDLTVGFAQEFGEKGIKVNCISPSDTATDAYKKFFPNDAKDAQSPEKIAELFVDLVGRDVTGKIFVIKDGVVSEGFHK